MDEMMEIADEYGLQVIEDACEALGAEFDGQRARDIWDIPAFSRSTPTSR